MRSLHKKNKCANKVDLAVKCSKGKKLCLTMEVQKSFCMKMLHQRTAKTARMAGHAIHHSTTSKQSNGHRMLKESNPRIIHICASRNSSLMKFVLYRDNQVAVENVETTVKAVLTFMGNASSYCNTERRRFILEEISSK